MFSADFLLLPRVTNMDCAHLMFPQSAKNCPRPKPLVLVYGGHWLQCQSLMPSLSSKVLPLPAKVLWTWDLQLAVELAGLVCVTVTPWVLFLSPYSLHSPCSPFCSLIKWRVVLESCRSRILRGQIEGTHLKMFLGQWGLISSGLCQV